MKQLALVALLACAKEQPAPPPAVASAAAPALSLAVTVDGVPATWTQDVFDRTPHFTVTAATTATRGRCASSRRLRAPTRA